MGDEAFPFLKCGAPVTPISFRRVARGTGLPCVLYGPPFTKKAHLRFRSTNQPPMCPKPPVSRQGAAPRDTNNPRPSPRMARHTPTHTHAPMGAHALAVCYYSSR